MTTVSIYGKKWLDLVFEGKNKEYGAYQLRQQSPKTTIFAFVLGVTFILGLGGIGALMSSFGEIPVIPTPPDLIDRTKVLDVARVYVLPKPEPMRKAAAASAIKDDVTKKDLNTNIIVVKRDENPDDVKTNIEPPTSPIAAAAAGTTAGATDAGDTANSGTSVSQGTTAAVDPDRVVGRESLDKLPSFPGGMQKFYTYIGNNFEKPDLNEEKTLTVLVSFVIERDGRISDIKVVKNPGSGLDREAIRVLKSLRTKWEPGIKDGKAVRTLYTLPITVKTE